MADVAEDPTPADETFGRRLRRERERRAISIASIAESSKVNAWLFEALERDDASRWPSGIFRRSFIRAYAQAVGLDEEATVREFLERFPDPNDPDPAAAAARASMSRRSALRRTLADIGALLADSSVLRSARRRLAAVAFDVTAVTTLGLAAYIVFGAPWMALSVAFAAYYAGSILALGNTPGVCLCAGSRDRREPSKSPRWRSTRSSAATLFSAVRSHLPLSEPPTS